MAHAYRATSKLVALCHLDLDQRLAEALRHPTAAWLEMGLQTFVYILLYKS